MATTLTGTYDELTYASFGIESVKTDENGDLIVVGKASDGGLDSDNQIVDPAWMAKSAPEWLSTGGNLRVQHNPQRDPAGVGIKVETDQNGATWVTAKVIEPVAQKLVSRGALRAYSVGIAKPTIVRDASAPGGRITGGELVEISLVDRPANKRCGITLVKSEVGAPAEYVQEIFGTAEDIGKALAADIVKGFQDGDSVPPFVSITELNRGRQYEDGPENNNLTLKNDDMSLTFTPNDLMRIVQNKFVEKHYDELAWQAVADAEDEALKNDDSVIEKDHREFSTSRRKDLASQGHALPDGSYPIPDADALHRAAILARSGHGNVSGARALIARRAKELGVANPLTSGDAKKAEDDIVEVLTNVVKEAEPVVIKEPEGTPKKKEKGKKAKGKKTLPPWLQDAKDAKPDAKKADADCDDDDTDDPDDATCKEQHAHTEKCSPSGTPQSASGAKDAHEMKEIPDTGPAPESPMPAGRKTPDTKNAVPENASPEIAALLRFKTIGIDTDLGRLHDLTCPAYSPEDVAKYHPYADFKSTIDTQVWQRKAVNAACGDLTIAKALTQVWHAAEMLKTADEGDLNDYRAEMHKAFRDANPGPTSYPSPGSIAPGKYNRPLITDGHSASSPGHDGPNTSASVASGPSMGAGDYDKPPLSAGHQSPSPSFMKGGFEYPRETGKPTVIHYAAIEKEKARRALLMMHDHLAHAFPSSCPMLEQNAYAVEDGMGSPALNPIVGIGKEETTVTETPVEKAVTDFNDEWLQKAQKKMRKKLGKKVLAGKITVDEARAKMGRTIAQKSKSKAKEARDTIITQVEKGRLSIDEARSMMGLAPWKTPETQAVGIAKAAVVTPVEGVAVGVDADVIKSAVSDAVKPLLEQLQSQNRQIEDLTVYKSEIESRFEKLADLADPTTAAFMGQARNPIRKSRPAGVVPQAEIAERTQQMMIRQLQRTARISDNPAEREAAADALRNYGNFE